MARLDRASGVALALLLGSLLPPAALADVPPPALTDRALWPDAVRDPKSFDLASRAELAVFAEVLADNQKLDGNGMVFFTGLLEVNRESTLRWRKHTHGVLLANFARARATCASPSEPLCSGPLPESFEALAAFARRISAS